jgi:hypothetical protein
MGVASEVTHRNRRLKSVATSRNPLQRAATKSAFEKALQRPATVGNHQQQPRPRRPPQNPVVEHKGMSDRALLQRSDILVGPCYMWSAASAFLSASVGQWILFGLGRRRSLPNGGQELGVDHENT